MYTSLCNLSFSGNSFNMPQHCYHHPCIIKLHTQAWIIILLHIPWYWWGALNGSHKEYCQRPALRYTYKQLNHLCHMLGCVMSPLRYLSANIVNYADDTVGLIVHNKQSSSGKMGEQLEHQYSQHFKESQLTLTHYCPLLHYTGGG